LFIRNYLTKAYVMISGKEGNLAYIFWTKFWRCCSNH